MGNCSGKRTFEVQNPSKRPEVSGSKYVRKDSFSFDEINVGGGLQSGSRRRLSSTSSSPSPPQQHRQISLSESSSDAESVTGDDVEEIDERHEVTLLTSPSVVAGFRHHVEVVAIPDVPKIKIEDLEDVDDDDVAPDRVDVAPDDVDVTEARRESVERVVRFSDTDADVVEEPVLKKSLSTVDIANELMKEIGSKVNFSEDGSILTNDSDPSSSDDEDDDAKRIQREDVELADDVTSIQNKEAAKSEVDDVTSMQKSVSDDVTSDSSDDDEDDDRRKANTDDVSTTVLGQVEVHRPMPEVDSDSDTEVETSGKELPVKNVEMSESESDDDDAKSVDSSDSKYIDPSANVNVDDVSSDENADDVQPTSGRFRIESLGN